MLSILMFHSNFLYSENKIEYYQEGTYQEVQNLYANSHRVTWESYSNNYFITYLRAGSERYSLASDPNYAKALNHTYASLGLKTEIGALSLSQEIRARKYSNNQTIRRNLLDHRSLLLFSSYWDKKLDKIKFVRIFNEIYSETFNGSAVLGNTIHTTYFRLGYKYNNFKRFTGDIFIEPKITKDLYKNFYNNLFKLKFASRLSFNWGQVNGALTVARAFIDYFPLNTIDKNPYNTQHWGNEILFTFGGVV